MPTEPVTGAPGLQWTAGPAVRSQLFHVNYFPSARVICCRLSVQRALLGKGKGKGKRGFV